MVSFVGLRARFKSEVNPVFAALAELTEITFFVFASSIAFVVLGDVTEDTSRPWRR
jgi:hypothetical protein